MAVLARRHEGVKACTSVRGAGPKVARRSVQRGSTCGEMCGEMCGEVCDEVCGEVCGEIDARRGVRLAVRQRVSVQRSNDAGESSPRRRRQAETRSNKTTPKRARGKT